MSDNKKYYYLKLKENFFESDTLILLESQKDGYLYSNILLKLYLRSLKNEGRLAFNNLIPYDVEMLATLTRHQVGTVEKALRMFEQLGLIEILDNGVIYMTDIQNFIGKSSSEADRQRSYQRRIVEEKQSLLPSEKENRKKSCKKSNRKSTPEIETEIETEIDNNSDSQSSVSTKNIVNLYHSICVSLPKVTAPLSYNTRREISERIKNEGYDAIKAVFEKAEESDFLTGKIQKGWTADLNWLMIFKNFCKVLEDKYRNRDREKRGEENAVDTEASTSTYKGYELTGITIL